MKEIELEQLAGLRQMLECVPTYIGLPQLTALVVVAAEPGLSVNDLAQRINVPQQTASRYAALLLGRYQEPGQAEQPKPLIEQKVNEGDPRRRALFLTVEGGQLISRLVAAGKPLKTV